jgi:hypothetical protein
MVLPRNAREEAMRRLFIIGGAALLVFGIAIHLLAYAVGFSGVILVPISYMVVALGIISIVLGIASGRRRPYQPALSNCAALATLTGDDMIAFFDARTWGFAVTCSWRTIVVPIAALLLMARPAIADALQETLKAWTAPNISAHINQQGQAKLFVRTDPVRAHLELDNAPTATEVRNAIEAFADTFQISREFTSRNANLILAVAPGITETGQGKPNRAMLRKFGLPDQAIDMMNVDWSTGCGAYTFGNASGRISTSVTFAETRLGADGIRRCITTGVLFGFGLRLKSLSAIDLSQGYVQYLLLARAIRSCSDLDKGDILKPSTSSTEDWYATCAANFKANILRERKI